MSPIRHNKESNNSILKDILDMNKQIEQTAHKIDIIYTRSKTSKDQAEKSKNDYLSEPLKHKNTIQDHEDFYNTDLTNTLFLNSVIEPKEEECHRNTYRKSKSGNICTEPKEKKLLLKDENYLSNKIRSSKYVKKDISDITERFTIIKENTDQNKEKVEEILGLKNRSIWNSFVSIFKCA